MHRSTIRPTTFSSTRPLVQPGPRARTGHLNFHDLEQLIVPAPSRETGWDRFRQAVRSWWEAR